MTVLITFLKVSGATVAGATVVGGGIGLALFADNKNTSFLSNNYDGKSPENISNPIVYSVAEAINSTDNSSTDSIGESSNYKCKIETTYGKTCLIEQITINDGEKKQINASSISSIATSVPTKSSLNKANTYFKLTISEDFYKQLTWSSTQKINVVSAGSEETALGSLKPLFAVKNQEITTKTIYSVGKLKNFMSSNEKIDVSAKTVTVSESEDNKCVFIKNDNEGLSCEIFKFVNDTASHDSLESLNFEYDASKLGIVKQDKYYLYKFTGSSVEKKVSEFKDSGNSTVKVTLNPEISEGDKKINILEIEDLIPVVLPTETSPSLIFVLK